MGLIELPREGALQHALIAVMGPINVDQTDYSTPPTLFTARSQISDRCDSPSDHILLIFSRCDVAISPLTSSASLQFGGPAAESLVEPEPCKNISAGQARLTLQPLATIGALRYSGE